LVITATTTGVRGYSHFNNRNVDRLWFLPTTGYPVINQITNFHILLNLFSFFFFNPIFGHSMFNAKY